MESVKLDPRVEGLVRDLRSTIERMQERVQKLEDRLATAEREGHERLTFGPYFALPRLSGSQITDAPHRENGNMVYNTTDHEVWVVINDVLRQVNTSPT